MNHSRAFPLTLTLLCVIALTGVPHALQMVQSVAPPSPPTSTVPRSVPFTGYALTPKGDARTGTVLLTFGLYTDQKDGAPLWTEQQFVTLDPAGRYSVVLGSASADGLPAEAFAAGTPKWLGVQVEGDVEQPRFMLLSVPYALKASDADTIGGKPVSEFVVRANLFDTVKSTLRSEGYAPRPANPATSVPGVLAAFTDTSNNIGNSNVVQNGSNIGINVSPAYPLHVFGATGGPFGYQTLRLDNPHVAGSSFTLGPTTSGAHVYSILSSGPASALGAGSLGVYDEGVGQFRLVIAPNGNVGIGTSTPTVPLSFANALGNKIALWGTGNGAHYGLGIQSGQLQLYTDLPSSNIVFGSGRSGLLDERMRIINGGGDGLSLYGRVILKNGTNPLDLNYGSGVWMYKADNTAPLGFMGVQNNQNLGFYGGPAGWGFTYDAINSRVGIGNNNPNAPLAFPPSLGKKITLYPGATGDVGLGVAGNRLQIYSDNPNADVAIGYDAAGVFNERFAVKPNGAIAILGNTGTAGQMLASSGASPAKWANGVNYIYNNITEYDQTSNSTSYNYDPIPGLSQSITLVKRSKVIVNLTGTLQSSGCFACSGQAGEIAISVNSLLPITGLAYSGIPNGDYINITTGNKVFTFDPGTYTLIGAYNNRVPSDVRQITATGFRMTVMIIPEE